ncbi:MAG: gamma-glutamyltransferase, partial [Saprospiraceae bacterium]|nr:gamma-glutamyltransferase [Saprospiraceae bacterium]
PVRDDIQLARVLNTAHEIRRTSPEIRHDSTALSRVLTRTYAAGLIQSLQPPEQGEASDEKTGETTHFSVVDRDGNAIAVTASINAYFGAVALSPRLGFLYNSYMDDFVFDNTDHVDAIRPRAAAYSSMSPTMVQRAGSTQLVIGSPGSARIISTVAQLTHFWISAQPSLEDLLMRPRVHAQSGRVYLEDPSSDARLFRAAGFTVSFPTYDLMQRERNAYFGGVHAIARSPGGWTGAADPRRDGIVMYPD